MGLTAVHFPENSITEIKEKAFFGTGANSKLESINIPKSLEIIGDSAFAHNDNANVISCGADKGNEFNITYIGMNGLNCGSVGLNIYNNSGNHIIFSKPVELRGMALKLLGTDIPSSFPGYVKSTITVQPGSRFYVQSPLCGKESEHKYICGENEYSALSNVEVESSSQCYKFD